jgi:hypothetical protein
VEVDSIAKPPQRHSIISIIEGADVLTSIPAKGDQPELSFLLIYGSFNDDANIYILQRSDSLTNMNGEVKRITNMFGGKSLPVLFCPPEILHGVPSNPVLSQ